MPWPTVNAPTGFLSRGTFNTSADVQDMALRMRGEIQKGAFNLYPKPNAPTGNRGQRTESLGSFQTGHKIMGKQHYDVRYNVHICKALILSWGRNAYTTDSRKGGAPIPVEKNGVRLEVFCHIDITTPRDNMLWHHVEGPHVVIEGYRKVGDIHPNRNYKPKSAVFELTPGNVFDLYVYERDRNAGKPMNDPTRVWPGWMTERLATHCLIG